MPLQLRQHLLPKPGILAQPQVVPRRGVRQGNILRYILLPGAYGFRQGRLARLRITLQDRPGALFRVMKEFDDHNVNIIEIYHQRIFTSLPAKGLITDIECEARDREQLDALVASLKGAGYAVAPVELN